MAHDCWSSWAEASPDRILLHSLNGPMNKTELVESFFTLPPSPAAAPSTAAPRLPRPRAPLPAGVPSRTCLPRSCLSLLADNMQPIRDWASLAPDLVELIGWRVGAGDLQDYVRFRAVCSHWGASTVRPHIRDPRFHPRRWMMFPEGHGLYPGHPDLRGFVRFLNLSTGALVRAHLPLLDAYLILDSVDGLLLLHRDRDTVIRLLHPFTGEIVDLPPLASLLPQTLRFCPLREGERSASQPYASVSLSSRGTVTVMLAFTGPTMHCVAYATEGDQRWTLWAPVTGLISTKFIQSSSGKIYMVEYPYQSCKVHIYRVDPPCTTADDGFPHFPLPVKIAEFPSERFGISSRLVECDSEILLVAYKDESHSDLSVYRLADLAIGRFVPVTSIGNYALVRGESCLCVLLSPNKWLPSISPNSVICVHNSQSNPNAEEYVFEQYSLGTGMWTPASGVNILEMPPPSPHEFAHHIFTCCYREYWNKGFMYSLATEPRWLKHEVRSAD